MGKLAIIAVLVCAHIAHAETRVKSSQLSLARGKAKAARLIVKAVEVDGVRSCQLRLVITPQHTLFKTFTLDVRHDKPAVELAVATIPGTDAIPTSKGRAQITRHARDVDAKIDVQFDQGGAKWTLGGVLKISDAPCQ